MAWAFQTRVAKASTGESGSTTRFATAAVLPSLWDTCQRGTKRQAASKGSPGPTVSRNVKEAKKCGPPNGVSGSPTAIVSSSAVSMNDWQAAKRVGPDAEKERTESAPATAQPSDGRSA